MPRSKAPSAPRGYLTRSAAATPADSTRAEAFYYEKQIAEGTRLVAQLRGGREVRGRLAWHDHRALGLVRQDGSEVVVGKMELKYVFKDETPEPAARRAQPRAHPTPDSRGLARR